MSKVQPGWFEGAPLDDFSLKRVVSIAGDSSLDPFTKLAAMLVEVIRAEGVKEMKRRGLLDKKAT